MRSVNFLNKKKRHRRRGVVNVRRVNSLICVAVVTFLEIVEILYFIMYPFIQIMINKMYVYIVVGVHSFTLLCTLYITLIMYKDVLPSIHKVLYISIFLILIIIINSVCTMVGFLTMVDNKLNKEIRNPYQTSALLKKLNGTYSCSDFSNNKDKDGKSTTSETKFNELCVVNYKILARDVTVYLNTVSLLKIVFLGSLFLIIYFFYYNIPVW